MDSCNYAAMSVSKAEQAIISVLVYLISNENTQYALNKLHSLYISVIHLMWICFT